ncbi:MAG: hypothetical protein R6U55_17545 [Desulfovermiculus sp.]
MHRKIFWFLTAILLSMALGCTALTRSNSDQNAEAGASANASLDSAASDYDFDDVVIPAEMKLQKDESFIMQTPQVKAGILVYTGWVDPVSLFSFYLSAMPNEGWNPLSYFKYGHYLLVFEKTDKVSVIRIRKGSFSTRLEIWVSPAMSVNESGISERVLSQ